MKRIINTFRMLHSSPLMDLIWGTSVFTGVFLAILHFITGFNTVAQCIGLAFYYGIPMFILLYIASYVMILSDRAMFKEHNRES